MPKYPLVGIDAVVFQQQQQQQPEQQQADAAAMAAAAQQQQQQSNMRRAASAFAGSHELAAAAAEMGGGSSSSGPELMSHHSEPVSQQGSGIPTQPNSSSGMPPPAPYAGAAYTGEGRAAGCASPFTSYDSKPVTVAWFRPEP
jgi:type II secretory pathway pseudopilin PulG